MADQPSLIDLQRVGVGAGRAFQNGSDELAGLRPLRWSSMALGLFMVLGAVGNALVCIAIFTDRRLQNVTNSFLFSLAVADLLVSVLVMPFGILTEMHHGYWQYGFALCACYSYADVFLCSASIVHMSIISLDRYLGISRPLKTRNKSKLVVTLKIVVVWIVTTMISCPVAILAVVSPADVYREGDCGVTNRYFVIYGSTLSFLIPCLIMAATYVRTTQLLKQQAILCGGAIGGGHDRGDGLRRTHTRRRRAKPPQRQNTLDDADEPVDSPTLLSRQNHSSSQNAWRKVPPTITTRCCSSPRIGSGLGAEPSVAETRMIDSSRLQALIPATYHYAAITQADNSQIDSMANPIFVHERPTNSPSAMETFRHKVKERTMTLLNKTARLTSASELANEQKATRVLGLVFACFFVCWTPFFALNFTTAFCTECEVPRSLASVFLWLGFISSTINPIIYTTFNKRFRQAFTNILRCRCHRFVVATHKHVSAASGSSFRTLANNHGGNSGGSGPTARRYVKTSVVSMIDDERHRRP